MAQRSEDGVGKTRQMSKRLERALAGWTRSAISIQASGSERPHQQAGHTEAPVPARQRRSKNLLHPPGRPHTDFQSGWSLALAGATWIGKFAAMGSYFARARSTRAFMSSATSG